MLRPAFVSLHKGCIAQSALIVYTSILYYPKTQGLDPAGSVKFFLAGSFSCLPGASLVPRKLQNRSFPASLVPPWCVAGCPINPFLFSWCLPGCPIGRFLPPWCLPGCPLGPFLPPWCLPGALQAVQLVLSCLPGASQAVQSVLSASLVLLWCLPGCPRSPFLPPWCLPGASQSVH